MTMLVCESRAHSRLGPSGSYRWISCPGSIAACAGHADAPSKYASEGTAAHRLAEHCLETDTDAAEHLGLQIQADGLVFTVDAEMAEAVQEYLDYVRPLGCGVYEVPMGLPEVHPDLGGTVDYVALRDGVLRVVDYKHGSGKSIDAKGNTQLMIYALGALSTITAEVTSVRLVIVQPRVYGEESVREWDITLDRLYTWCRTILQPAAHACDDPKAPRRSGPWCDWCDGRIDCPAQQQYLAEVTGTQLIKPQVAPLNTLTEEQLLRLVAAYDMLAAYAKEGMEYMEREAIERGRQFDGYKLVKAKSNRKWTDEKAAAESLTAVLGEGAYAKKLLSPSQAEKKLKVRNLDLNPGLVEKPDNGLKLVPESDKRRAVQLRPTLMFLDNPEAFQ